MARMVTAAVAALGRPPEDAVQVQVRALAGDGSEAAVLLPDARSLSVDGVERLLVAGASGRHADRLALEFIDGTDSGVPRVVSSAAPHIVVGVGAPVRQVISHVGEEGQDLIAVAATIEVWVHGGGILDAAGTVHLAAVLGRALSAEDPA
jgi:hypothetical protein